MLLITKIFSSIVITMSGFNFFKIIQISVYRVRISENLVSLHERVPNLSISSINSAEVQLQPATREIRSLGLLLSPGRGLVLGLLIFFLLSFSFSAFASLSSLVLFLLNSTLYSQNASAHVTYGINSKV